MSDTPLLDALDVGAQKLLDMAMAPERDESGAANLTTLAERVKAFEAVVKWAETRRELAPPEKKESKFDVIRSEFLGLDGKTPRRRRTATAKKEPNGAEPAEPESDDGGLFES